MFAYLKRLVQRDIGMYLQPLQSKDLFCFKRSGTSYACVLKRANQSHHGNVLSVPQKMNAYFLEKQYKNCKDVTEFNKGRKMIETFTADSEQNQLQAVNLKLLHGFIDFYVEFNETDEALAIFNIIQKMDNEMTLEMTNSMNVIMSSYVNHNHFSKCLDFFYMFCGGSDDDTTLELHQTALKGIEKYIDDNTTHFIHELSELEL
eukprot:UN01389